MSNADNMLEKPSPGKIFVRTDQHGVKEPLFKYLDTLIKLLPGYSNQEICSSVELCPSKDLLEAKVEHLRQLHQSARFAVIVQDEKMETDTEYQFLANTILESRTGSKKLADNFSFVYLDKEQFESCLSDHDHFNFKATPESNEDAEGATAADFDDADRPDDGHWLRIGTKNVEAGLMDFAAYLLKLGQELKIISKREVSTYNEAKLNKLAKQAIEFTDKKVDVDCVDYSKKLTDKKREYRNLLLGNLDSLITSIGLIKKDGSFYFDEVIGAHKWGTFNGKTLRFFPDSAYLQKTIGKTEMNSKSDLKRVFRSFGLRVATDKEEERRYGEILENDWANISAATGIYRLKEEDGFKYYFHLGNTKTAKCPWTKVAKGKNLSAFPGSHIIRKVTGDKTIFSLDDLKGVWKRLGLKIASEEEDNLGAIKRIIERNWKRISLRTGIKQMPGKDGALKYFFDSASDDEESYKGMASFPTQLFVRGALAGKDSVTNAQELKQVWKRLGLAVATEDEESLEHLRRVLRYNFDDISRNAGICLLPGADGNERHYFRDCAKNPDDWGSVGGVAVKDFPSADYIKGVIGKDSITDPEELKLVWQELGLENLAEAEEEDLSQVRALIENNWEEISSNIIITREKDKLGTYVYYLNTGKEKPHLWGRLGKLAVKDFPSAEFIQSVIDKPSIESIEELSKVWKALGLNIGSKEDADALAYQFYQKQLVANIREIVASTGIIYEGGQFYFGDCKGASHWCEVNGRPLASFPNGDYLSGILDRRQIRNIDDLKKALGSLGLKTASDEDEKWRYGEVLEDSWDEVELTKKTGVERRFDEKEECYKYFFLLATAPSGSKPWGKVADRRLEHYPGAKVIKSILGEEQSHINTASELKQVCTALGLRVASEEEERTELPRKIIEENWDVLKDQLRVLKLAGDELDENGKPILKYYFSQAKATAQDWARVPGYNMVKTFPNSAVIQEIIGEPTVQSLDNLKRMWQGFGLDVASEEEEQGLAKKLIEMNWQQLSTNTGVVKRVVPEHQDDEQKIKYFFKFAKGSGVWGKVGDLKTVKTFPDRSLIRSVLTGERIQSVDDLKQVWKKLGLEVATEEEEKKFVEHTLEDSWPSITENTGVILVPTFNGLTYHFRFARPRNEWGEVEAAHDRSITSYPSGPEVREILTKQRPDNPADLKKLWAALGLNVATTEEEQDLPRIMIEEFNWDYVSENTGMKRVQSVKGPYVYYVSEVKDLSEWADMPGIKLANDGIVPITKFPELQFIKQTLDRPIDSKRAGIETKEELAQVWEALGLRVTETKEEAVALAESL